MSYTTIAEGLRRWSRQTPDTTAIVEQQTGRRISFAQFDRKIDQTAWGMAHAGVKRGDRVLFLVKPSIQLYVALYALFRIGAIPILIDPGMGLRQVLKCVASIRPTVLVGLPIVHVLRQVSPMAFSSVKVFFTSGWFGGVSLNNLGETETEPYAAEEFRFEDEGIIAFTSGSTGPAKGVVFTQGMMARQGELIGEAYQWQPGEAVVMCFAAFAMFSLSTGSVTVLPDMNMAKPATVDPTRIVAAIRDYEAPYAMGSPIIWQRVVRHCEARQITLPGVRHLITTGAPIPLNLHERLHKILPTDACLHTPYGATEVLPLTTIDSRELLRDTAEATRTGMGTCVGRPFPGMTVHVIAVGDQPIAEWSPKFELDRGVVGEIVAEGDVVSPEYKDLPEPTLAAKIGHKGKVLHRMGDLGMVDDAGRVWFCGRKAHRLETVEGMVPCVPVENVFNQHPSVFRTALVGVGPMGEQRPVLCVELEKGIRWAEPLRSELTELVKGTRWDGLVDRFLVHPGFPVDARHNSKIRREELARWAQDRLGQQGGTT